MNYIPDYIAGAFLLWNILSTVRMHKNIKGSVESILSNNRQLLANILTDIVKQFGHVNIPPIEVPSQQFESGIPVTPNPAQFGAPSVTSYPESKV